MKIRDVTVGEGRCYVIAEIGINHNGDPGRALEMIDEAESAGADAVKFQKRTVSLNYERAELEAARSSPFGPTNGDLKHGLEFSVEQHRRLRIAAEERGLAYILSPWDVPSVSHCVEVGVDAIKIPSARLHREDIAEAVVATGLPAILSTGMSAESEVVRGVDPYYCIEDLAIMACVSAYPCGVDDLNLARIARLRSIFRARASIGYSSHAVSPWPSLCAVAMGAELIECHVTLDRSMWGSDQAASLEFPAFAKLVEEIRAFERARGSRELKVLPCEEAVRAKLRR